MRLIRSINKITGFTSTFAGQIAKWLSLVLVIIIVYDVLMRYFFDSPTNWSYILSYMLGSCIIALGLPYVYYHRANIRVDVFYTRFSQKIKAILDLLFTIIFGIPLVFVLTYVFVPDAFKAFQIGEIAVESIWYPKLWPFKTVIALAFCLLLVQVLSTFLIDLLSFIKGDKKA